MVVRSRGGRLGWAQGGDIDRRAVVAALAGLLVLPRRTLAAETGSLEALTFKLRPLEIPGRTARSHVRLEAHLIVRDTKEFAKDIQMLTDYRPRIVGKLLEMLSDQGIDKDSFQSGDVKDLKNRIRDIVNDAVGQPVVADVLIVGLILS